MANDQAKTLINNLKKPFEDLKLKRTSTLVDFLSMVKMVGDSIVEDTRSSEKVMAKTKGIKTKPTKNIPVKVKHTPPIKPEAKTGDPKEDLETNSTDNTSSIVAAIKGTSIASASFIGSRITDTASSAQQHAEELQQTMITGMFGPLSGIADSTKSLLGTTLVSVAGLAKDRFVSFRHWRTERKEASKQAKAQKKTTKAVEDLAKDQKKRWFVDKISGLSKPITSLVGIVGSMVSSIAGLAGSIASKLGGLVTGLIGGVITTALATLVSGAGLAGVGAILTASLPFVLGAGIIGSIAYGFKKLRELGATKAPLTEKEIEANKAFKNIIANPDKVTSEQLNKALPIHSVQDKAVSFNDYAFRTSPSKLDIEGNELSKSMAKSLDNIDRRADTESKKSKDTNVINNTPVITNNVSGNSESPPLFGNIMQKKGSN